MREQTPPSSLAWRPARGGPITVRIPVPDLSRAGESRRAADAIARACGLDETARGKLGIVVTEAATNLARHAREGELLFRDMEPTGVPGVEMLAVDRGPGMENLSRYLTDGFSTGGTGGTGLGAMRRMADLFDLYSLPGQGTIVLGRVFASDQHAAAPPPRLLDVGAVCLPIEGETACGDGWHVRQGGDNALVLIVDGLGHGPNAAEAADAAVALFRDAPERAPHELVTMMHEALRATRGAAVAVAELRRDGDGAAITYCGVGNTVATVVGHAGPRSLPSMNGTAGLSVRGVKEFKGSLRPGECLVLHTDGVTTRWRLDAYANVRDHDPAVAAALLHRDFTRERDDSTVLALALCPPAR